jgi:DNA polymerase-3 subunit alpha
VDAVVFPKSFERIEALLQTDARLMVWGKVDRRDEMLQLIVDDAEPIDEVKIVMVEIDVQRAKNIQDLHQLKEILLRQRGEDHQAKIPVVAIVQSGHHRHLVRLGSQFRVQNSEATVAALAQQHFQARATTLLKV